MKNFFTLVLAVGLALMPFNLSAEIIDVEQAKNNVADFLRNSTTTKGVKRRTPALTQANLLHAYTQNTTSGQPAVYVFTTGEKGFVLAAADDRAIRILGYSDEDTFDPNDLPLGLKDMLENYAAEISHAPALLNEIHPTDPVTDYEVEETEPILPLLGDIRWGQLSPYNKKFPIALTSPDGDGHASTGCMTTALVQIMRYHQHPKRGYGSNYQVREQGALRIPEVFDYYAHNYNWELMHPTRNEYTKTANGKGFDPNAEDVQEVATIMADVAAALRTTYGNVSSAVNISIIPALLSYFDYDPNIEQVKRKNLSTQEEWNSIIINELQNQRPVYLDGFPEGTLSGHAFLCDGYDGKGYFHINWGWDGTSNGYYQMTALNPSVQGVGSTGSGYSSNMALLRGMQPNQSEVKFRPSIHFLDYSNENIGIFRMQDNNTNVIYYGGRLYSSPGYHIRARLGVRIVHGDGRVETAWDDNGEPVNILSNNTYYDFRVDIRPEWQHAGAKVYYIYQECGDTQWHYIRNHENRLYFYRYYYNDKNQLCITIDKSEPGFVPDASEEEIASIPPVFPLNFPYDADATRTDQRAIGNIGMQVEGYQPQVFSVDDRKVYRNMTGSAVFTAPAGATVTPSITYAKGNWMNSYFYIDLDGDNLLSYNADKVSQEGTELVSYSFWTGDETNGESGYNSNGDVVRDDARDNLTLPAFTAPMKAGRYNVRFKIDWNCVNPAGNPGTNGKNNIINNGGYIVDAVLVVTDPNNQDNELTAAIEYYNGAVAAYNTLLADYRNSSNQSVLMILVDLATELDSYTNLHDVTAVEYNSASAIILSKVGEARQAIQQILGTNTPDNTQKSHEAHLSMLYVGAGTVAYDLSPEFSPEVYEYTITVPEGTTGLNIVAVPADSEAQVSGAGYITLTTFPTPVTVTITAPDGTTKLDYSLTIQQETKQTEQSHEAHLSTLYVGAGTVAYELSPEFSPEVYDYTITVPEGTTEVTIAAVPTDSEAQVSGAGNINLTAFPALATVTVTAPDGTTALNYSITILQEEGEKEEDQTGITQTETKTTISRYDLSGRPVVQPQKGQAFISRKKIFLQK